KNLRSNMINKFYIIFFIMVFTSCNNSEIKKNELNNNSSLKYELISKLNLNKIVNKILFVPDNSCKGCLLETIEWCEKLTARSNIKLYYFNELNLEKNDCAKSQDSINFKIDYINYDIYGITLFELLKDSIKVTYIEPSNLDSIYSAITQIR